MTMGIYAITNTEDGKAYIGSTVNFKKRLCIHKARLRSGHHDNSRLQRAWNKYGEAAFELGVLEYLEDSEELHLAEQFWMDIYREEGKELYNFGLAARNPMLGRTISEGARHKNSEAHKGNNPSKKTRDKISRALTGRSRMPFSEKWKCNIARARAKKYPSFHNTRTGEVIPSGVNLVALCRKRGLDAPTMCNVKNGKVPSYRGWRVLLNVEVENVI